MFVGVEEVGWANSAVRRDCVGGEGTDKNTIQKSPQRRRTMIPDTLTIYLRG